MDRFLEHFLCRYQNFRILTLKNFKKFSQIFQSQNIEILKFFYQHKKCSRNRSRHYFDTWGSAFESLGIILHDSNNHKTKWTRASPFRSSECFTSDVSSFFDRNLHMLTILMTWTGLHLSTLSCDCCYHVIWCLSFQTHVLTCQK